MRRTHTITPWPLAATLVFAAACATAPRPVDTSSASSPLAREQLVDGPTGRWSMRGEAPGAPGSEADGATASDQPVALAGLPGHDEVFAFTLELWVRAPSGHVASRGARGQGVWLEATDGSLTLEVGGERFEAAADLGDRWRHVTASWEGADGRVVLRVDGHERIVGRTRRRGDLPAGGLLAVGGGGASVDEVAWYDHAVPGRRLRSHALVAARRRAPTSTDPLAPAVMVANRTLPVGFGRVVFGPDLDLAATTDADLVRLWDVPTRRLLRTLDVGGFASDVALSADRRALLVDATTYDADPRNAHVYDPRSGALLTRVELSRPRFEGLGARLVGYRADAAGAVTVLAVDLRTGEEEALGSLPAPEGGGWTLLTAGAPRPRAVLLQPGLAPVVHDLAGGTSRTLDAACAGTAATLDPRGDVLHVEGCGAWDTRTGARLGGFGADALRARVGATHAATASPTGVSIRRLDGSSARDWTLHYDPDTRRTLLAPGAVPASWRPSHDSYAPEVLAWSRDGARAVVRVASSFLIVGLDDERPTALTFEDDVLRSWLGDAAPDPRADRLATCDGYGVRLWNLGRGRPERDLLPVGAGAAGCRVAFSPDGRLLAGAFGRALAVWDLDDRGGAPAHTLDAPANIDALAFTQGGGALRATLEGGGVVAWEASSFTPTPAGDAPDARAPQGALTATPARAGGYTLTKPGAPGSVTLHANAWGWAMVDDEGHFAASPNAARFVYGVQGDELLHVDQVALALNRPDLVLARLGTLSPRAREHFTRLHERRRRRAGEGAHAGPRPTARLRRLRRLEGDRAEVILEANDPGGALASYALSIDGVEVFARALEGRHARRRHVVELVEGRNTFELVVTNRAGVTSRRASDALVLDAPTRGDLHFIGVGVSDYADPRVPDLAFAHVDARDLAELFGSVRLHAGATDAEWRAVTGEAQGFDDVHVHTLLQDQVTPAAIAALSRELAGARPQDTVVVFVSGHGVHELDADGLPRFYYMTHQADPDDLTGTAASYDLIEGLLDGIRARRKVLLLDTCESGEAEAGGGGPAARLDGMTARGFSVRARDAAPPAPAWVTSPDGFIDRDLRQRTGAVVVSSSRGDESSYESTRHRNGVFTQAIIEAMTDTRLTPGALDLRALERHVKARVPTLTAGRQHPVTDRDNLRARITLGEASGRRRQVWLGAAGDLVPDTALTARHAPTGLLAVAQNTFAGQDLRTRRLTSATIRVYDASGKQLATLDEHTGAIRAVHFSANGETLLSLGEDGARLWNLESSSALSFTPLAGVSTLGFDPATRRAAVGMADGTIVYDPWGTKATLSTPVGLVTHVAFMGPRLVVQGSAGVALVDTATGATVALGADLDPRAATTDPDRGLVWLLSDDGLRAYGTSGALTRHVAFDATRGTPTQRLAVDPTGRWIAMGWSGEGVRIMDLNTGEFVRSLAFGPLQAPGVVELNLLAFSADGATLHAVAMGTPPGAMSARAFFAAEWATHTPVE
jgi:WD40 repeat protein